MFGHMSSLVVPPEASSLRLIHNDLCNRRGLLIRVEDSGQPPAARTQPREPAIIIVQLSGKVS